MSWTALNVLVTFVVATGYAAKFPKNWTTCKTDSTLNECLKGAVQNALTELSAGGMPSLGILPLDPLHFDRVVLDQGDGPVNIKLEFSNLDVFGIHDIHIDSVESDWKTMTIKSTTPKVTLKGNYKVGGKILLLPVQGDGPCVLTLDNFKGALHLHFGEKKTGNKVYYNVDKMDFDFDTDRMTFQLENLFNGDKALGDNMNKFLNQNWKEILNELKPNVAATFAAAFKEVSNRLFSKIDRAQITPP